MFSFAHLCRPTNNRPTTNKSSNPRPDPSHQYNKLNHHHQISKINQSIKKKITAWWNLVNWLVRVLICALSLYSACTEHDSEYYLILFHFVPPLFMRFLVVKLFLIFVYELNKWNSFVHFDIWDPLFFKNYVPKMCRVAVVNKGK